MTKQELIDVRNLLFDDKFRIIAEDRNDIIDFCKELTNLTGIQSCNVRGDINELLENVYLSALSTLE